MLNPKQRLRSFVYDCFPELAPSGDESWPSTMLHRLASTSERMSTLVTLVQVGMNQKRRGTVVLLPPEGFTGPRFLSLTVVSTGRTPSFGSSDHTAQVQFPLHWFLPAGGWVVSHGCSLVDVFVGNKHQSTGPDSLYCLLSDPVEIGMYLGARVCFDGTERTG